MILFKLGMRNLKRNFSNYLVYFCSLVFSVFIFFSFSAIYTNETILAFSEANIKIAAAFKVGLSIIGIFISIFIWYSNSFFIKSRSKEIGLYNFLGINKRQIGFMILLESFIFYLFALVVGTLLGILLNKFIIMYLVYFLKIRVYISFSIAFSAVVETVKIFLILYMIIGINSLELIFSSKIIDLFSYERKNDMQPKLRVIPGIVGVVMIGIAYYIAYKTDARTLLSNFLLDAGLVITGMFLLYHGFLPLLLGKMKSVKKISYSGMNLIILSNLSSRVKKHANQFVMITLISSIILTSLASAYSFNKILRNMIDVNQFYSYALEGEEETYNKILGKIHEHDAKINSKIEGEVLLFKEKEKFSDSSYMIKLSDYMKDMENKGLLDEVYEKLQIGEGEFLRVLNFYTQGEGDNTDIYNDKIKLKYGGSVKYPFGNNIHYANKIIVSDETFYKYERSLEKKKIYGINIEGIDYAKELSRDIAFIMPMTGSDNYYYTGLSYERTYSLLTFIVSFMAIVFMLAIGSVTYFKQLTDMKVDKEKFDILSKIGISEKDMKKALAKQIAFMYFIPILLAISNTVVALRVLERILFVSVLDQMLKIILAFLVIYGAYYILTLKKYYKLLFSR